MSLETIESFEAHTRIVASSIDQPPTKVRAVDNTFLSDTRASLVANAIKLQHPYYGSTNMDLQAWKLVCNRVRDVHSSWSEMASSGHLCAECMKTSNSLRCTGTLLECMAQAFEQLSSKVTLFQFHLLICLDATVHPAAATSDELFGKHSKQLPFLDVRLRLLEACGSTHS